MDFKAERLFPLNKRFVVGMRASSFRIPGRILLDFYIKSHSHLASVLYSDLCVSDDDNMKHDIFHWVVYSPYGMYVYKIKHFLCTQVRNNSIRCIFSPIGCFSLRVFS